jgi:hypothetical protein
MQVCEKWLRLNPTTELDHRELDGRESFKTAAIHSSSTQSTRHGRHQMHAAPEVVSELHVRWLRAADERTRRAATEDRETVKRRGFRFFEQGKQPDEVVVEVRLALEIASALHEQMAARFMCARPKIALAKDREALYQRLAAGRRRHEKP